jgi:hypothetical protein
MQVNSFSAMPWLIRLPSRMHSQRLECDCQDMMLTRSDLGCGRPCSIFVKMSDILPEEFVKKVLPQGACCPGRSNADTQGAKVSNDESRNEQVDEIENEMVNVTGEGRRVLACSLLVELRR